MSEEPLRIATRGSALALWQAESVRAALGRRGYKAELVIAKTSGDGSTAPFSQLSGTGFFVKELEDRLLRGEADLAVHSLKDLPTALPDGLRLGAALERADPRDALVSRQGVDVRSLPPGAVIGTSSPRRVALLSSLRSDLSFESVRGNVDTRLARLAEGKIDALVLAMAGLRRLGKLNEWCVPVEIDAMTPAPCQGAIGIECRADDERALQAIGKLQHAATRTAIDAERAFVASLGGGCQAPIGVYGTIEGKNLLLKASVASLDGVRRIDLQRNGMIERPVELGERLAEGIQQRGARDILDAVRAAQQSGA